MHKKYFLLPFFILFLLQPLVAHPPAVEVRAVWLTTNYGLDWPKNRTSHETQKQELITLLDSLQAWNFNTLLFQVRARGEVFYRSTIEPMSSLIVPGKWNESPFDPLAFAIEESHKRGMECHAWMVTYPLGGNRHVNRLGNKSAVKMNPGIVKQFQREWFLDPGNPNTDEYLLSMVKELVSFYDIDGIHFDYIRYPDNRGRFPDDDTYRKHGGGQNRADWRRDNITRFVNKAYDLVKKTKPWVTVSSAPLGRYRALGNNGHGWTALEAVYQDAGKWMKDGKHDAIFPMMYYKNHLFYPFVDDWLLHSNNRIVVPGLGPYQMIELNWDLEDITNQVDYLRKQPTHGQAYFRVANLLDDTKGILQPLRQYYRHPAKLPSMPWLSEHQPEKPTGLHAEQQPNGTFTLEWEAIKSDTPITYNVYRSDSTVVDFNNVQHLMATGLRQPRYEYNIEKEDQIYYYFITVSDAYRTESEASYPALFFHSDLEK